MPSPVTPPRPLRPLARVAVAVYLAAWAATLIVPPAVMLRWRETRLARLADPASQAAWDAFRADMRLESDATGPVQRKVPRSPEPPELVWLRDYLRPGSASAAEDQPRGERHHEEQHDRDAEHAEEGKHRPPPR